MLEKLVNLFSTSIISLALFSCTIHKPNKLSYLFLDDFCVQKEIIDENYDDEEISKKIYYNYKNGIDVDVFYKKNKKIKEIHLDIKKDINNLLIKNTPKEQSIDNDFNYSLYYQETHFRELTFQYNCDKIKVTFNQDSSIYYNINGSEPKLIHYIFYPKIYEKLKDIDENLFISEHIMLLNSL